MLIFATICIAILQSAVSIKSIPGQPVPHAEVLDKLFTKFLGPSFSNNGLLDLLLGTANTTDINYDNLDINVLDVDNIKKIIKLAKLKYNETYYIETRRQQAYEWHPYIMEKAKTFMLHTIYLTRERLNETRKFRQKYINYHSYQIALMYGAASAILHKMQMLVTQMSRFWWRTHFIWFLIIYEKLLAGNVDITNLVERIFIIQKRFAKIRGAKKANPRDKLNFEKAKASRPDLAEFMIHNQPGK